MTKTNRTLLSSMFVAGLMASPLGFADEIEDSSFYIENCEHLAEVAYNHNRFSEIVIINDNINCVEEGVSLTPIGSAENPFTGKFYYHTNGQAIITVDKIERVSSEQQENGLFGATANAEIKNIHIQGEGDGVHVEGLRHVGGVVGRHVFGELILDNVGTNLNVAAVGDADPYGQEAGGLVGLVDDWGRVIIKKSRALGSVEARQKVGGLLGIGNGEISESYVKGQVRGQKDVGALVGKIRQTVLPSTIVDSYSTAQLSFLGTPPPLHAKAVSEHGVGGLVGGVLGNLDILYAYYAGQIDNVDAFRHPGGGTPSQPVEGLVGFTKDNAQTRIRYSYWSHDKNPELGDDGYARTELQMRSPITYRTWYPYIWNIQPGSYPTLKNNP